MTPEPALDPTWRVTTKFFKRGRSVVHAQVKPRERSRHIGTFGEEASKPNLEVPTVGKPVL